MRLILRTLVWTIIVSFVFIMWYTLISDKSSIEELEKNLLDTRNRLKYIESLNQQHEITMFKLKSQLLIYEKLGKSELRTNSSRSQKSDNGTDEVLLSTSDPTLHNVPFSHDLSLPNIYTYLPHLKDMPNAIQPWFKLSQSRYGVSLVIGVPTIKRNQESYLMNTLDSLIYSLSETEKEDVLIVVSICEIDDQSFVNKTIIDIQMRYTESISSGLLEIIVPSPYYYPSFDILEDKFGDTMERVKWRTKQNLDYSYMMMYACSRGYYYLQLEDDVMTKPGYIGVMKSFASSQASNKWLLLEFSHLGFIGKLFKVNDLPFVIEFFLMFHKDKPVDWLLDHLLYVKTCNPEKSNKHCFHSMEQLRKRYKPSLFQHVGTFSSLKGKVQKLKDKDFKKGQMVRAHSNPPADVFTSIKIYEAYSLELAYVGNAVFWGVSPKRDDVVIFKFLHPTKIGRYLFRSGDADHPGDKFYNTSIEVLPVSNNSSFVKVGKFNDESGVAEGIVPQHWSPVESLRLLVHEDSRAWVILSEIMIEEVPTV